MACWLFGPTFALFWSPGAPERRIWLFSCQMLHFVSQTVANFAHLMVGAEQVALQAVTPKSWKVLKIPCLSHTEARGWRPTRPTIPECQNLTSWGCNSSINRFLLFFEFASDSLGACTHSKWRCRWCESCRELSARLGREGNRFLWPPPGKILR